MAKTVTRKDFISIAEFITTELDKRKQSDTRKRLEKIWKQIDRQISMTPDDPIPGDPAWYPNAETALQTQALEILTADSRRMMFSDERNYFSANGMMDDTHIKELEAQGMITGDSNDIPTLIMQDDLNSIIEGAHTYFENLYDYRRVWDMLNSEAFKYGTFVARGRLVEQENVLNTTRGVVRNKNRVPVLCPLSIKDTYLDESQYKESMTGFKLEPSFIHESKHDWNDLHLAAKSGTSDIKDSIVGGWRMEGLRRLKPDGNDQKITVIQYEGDIVIPRTKDNLVFKNIIIDVGIGSGGTEVIRVRENAFPFRSYISQPYQQTQISPYGDGPLMKGMTLARAAAQTFNTMQAVAILSGRPPLAYDPFDPHFASRGGPVVEPNALWETESGIETQDIGDMGELSAIYAIQVGQYQDVTGISAPRLGAQTKSHQTAFAVETEVARGQVRTVDYVRTVQRGAMQTWLTMEFELMKETLKKPEDIFLPDYNGWVTITAKTLPKRCVYDIHGAAELAVEAEKQQRKSNAIQQLIQISGLELQMQGQGNMDWDAIKREALTSGGINDADRFIKGNAGASPTPTDGPVVPGAVGLLSSNPNTGV